MPVALGSAGILPASCGAKPSQSQSLLVRRAAFKHRRGHSSYWSASKQRFRYGEVAIRAQSINNNNSLQRSDEEKGVNGNVNGVTNGNVNGIANGNGNVNGVANGNGYAASIVMKDGAIALKQSPNGQVEILRRKSLLPLEFFTLALSIFR